jgi:Ala-tRNA(Pro) deacylase
MSESEAPQLVDGSAPATPAELFERLDALGIPHATVQHPPVFTVEEAQQHRGDEPGAHVKNLFFKTKKGMALLVCLEDRALDLKPLGGLLELGRLSFGRPPRLMSYLGVSPGSVTPFSVLNDKTGVVRLFLDEALRESETVYCHPLDNAQTTAIATADLLRFLEAVEHSPTWLDLTEVTK